MKFNVLRWLATAGAAGFLAMILSDSAAAQVLPGKRAEKAPAKTPAKAPAAPAAKAPAAPAAPATPAAPNAPAAERDAIKGVRETPAEVRREAKDAVQDTRREAREAPGEVRREAREDVRDARQDVREARQAIRATRAADFGVWLNTRAAQGVANGLVIADLAAQGVFATAGFREGDRIVSINGQPVTTEAQFVQLLTVPTREQVTIVVFRDGQQQTILLQPTALTQAVINDDPFYQYGIVIDDRNPNQIIVQRIYPRTPAFYAGLRAGDIIVGLAGQPIRTLDAFTTALRQADDTLALQVTRGGQTREFDLNVSSSGSVRTALRPDLDAQGRINAQGAAAPGARANATGGAAAGATAPGTPQTPTAPSATPTRPVPAGTPTSPSQPRTPVAPGGAPAAVPGAPTAVPGAPTAAPGAPTAPAAPRAGAGAAGDAKGGAGGNGT